MCSVFQLDTNMENHTNRAQIVTAFTRKLIRLSCSFPSLPTLFTIMLMSCLYSKYKFEHRNIASLNSVGRTELFSPDSPPNYVFRTIDNNFTISDSTHSIFRMNFSAKTDSYVSLNVLDDPKTDLILIWTGFFRMKYLYDNIEDMTRHIYLRNQTIHRPAFCEDLYPNCVLTSDRRYLNRSNQVVFHYPDLDANDFPHTRTPDQMWTLYSNESPKNVKILPRPIMINFNATSLYHSQSDMPLPYGETYRSKNVNYIPKLTDKKYPIVWLSSRCSVESLRQDYIKLLKKYVYVGIYGGCSAYFRTGLHFCSKTQFAECHKKLYREHYFYLAFENSFCDEYATEKIFMSLQHDIVPIVYGALNYSRLLPPHSFIDATKYKPADLAIYVHSLIANRTAYLEYFDWKRKYRTRGDRRGNDYFHCEICRYAQRWRRGEVARKSMTMKQINDWWEGTCWPEAKVRSFLIE